ncbi:molybdopterin molybdotransferase MoeA [Sulfuricurvum sp.]|uniref:molybdopterin molybdotransferase MoeA n=2 Tax=Sulfuricurvum sp. TaxID=2025608 RepID=UPI00260E9505|nr:molybdopterin molybdotransferase MoeA [Sulfuricurvum sp.]MDD2837634.1 molybdopterin molybdotransferase MoeA [Sulfuricurvum sp.]MDD3596467.1 molybdopterin molybdotransferase MoeA [Sulfuricurvum sp.]MDD4883589.1 molybdopterin molybdotransferase MoeA [Sulfuricurvum sp.]
MISYETSQNMISLLPMGSLRGENVFLGNALGRILAEDIVAQEDYPLHPTSSMDGYAIVHSDLEEFESFIIHGDNPAGADEIGSVMSGVCIKTFTGSLMPEGSDTLVPIENVRVEGDEIVIEKPVPKGFAVRPVGESYREGEVLISKGTKLGFAEIGVLAGINRVMIRVTQPPRVAIIATGSEVLDIGESARHEGQIRSSNSYTLQALVDSLGAKSIQLGIVGDDKHAIMERFEEAMRSADIIVSTGGVSVGDYDFVKHIVPKLGADVIFKGVNIKPGQHVMVAQRGEKFIISLPGFAYSSTVTFILYAAPLIARMMGMENPYEPIEATLKVPFAKRSNKSEFTACNLSFEDGRYWVDFEGKKSGSSAILTNLLGNAGLMICGEEDGDLEAGTLVRVIKL